MWPLVLTSLVTAQAPVVPWLLTPSIVSLVDLLSLFSTLSKAYLGYLPLVRAFLRWSISCWSNSGLLHTVLTLWERELMTLNLAVRWWWLSHCRYWSVCVGFLYTVMDRLPSDSGLTNGVQEGDGPILFLVLHCKPDGRVNTVNVLKEVLFVDLLVDDKGVIHKPVTKPSGRGST